MELDVTIYSPSLIKLRRLSQEHPLFKKWNKFRANHSRDDKNKYYFDWRLLYKKFNPPVCYLTGITIDLKDKKAYSLDHIIPISRGGNCSIGNCGLLSRAGNMLKHDLTLKELDEIIIKIQTNRANWINL